MGFPKSGRDAFDRLYREVTQAGISRNLVEAELITSVSWLIKLRWIAGAGVLIATWLIHFLFRVGAPIAILSGIGVAILLYNTFFFIGERRAKKQNAPADVFQSLAIWQTALDWLAMTLLFHYSGGVESPAIWYFVFHIIIAAIFFPRRTAFLLSILAIILVSGTVFLEYIGWVPHQKLENFLPLSLYQSRLYVLGVLSFFSTTAIFVTFLVSSIQDRLRRREAEVIHLTEDLQRATVRLQAINEISKVVGSTLDLKQVLDRLVETTAKAMGVRACSIRMLDKSGRYLEPVAVYGLSQTYVNKGPVDATNPLAKETLSGRVVNVPNAPQSPLLQYPLEARQEGIQSMLSAPLMGKSGPMGILRVYDVKANRFDEEDEEFISAIAAQGSIAIENAMAYQAMSELDKMKSQFIHTATHELRSPVSVTRSLLRTITAGYAGEVSEQQKEILERATRRIDFLQKLIDDLLDLAAGKVGKFISQEMETISLREIIEKVVERYKIPAQEKAIELRFKCDCPQEKTYVKATVDGLDRVFNNLISNAVKYTLQGGKVLVEMQPLDGEVHIAVQDSGIGIPEEALPNLFTEFYRAPNAREMVTEGTGLGLAITKDIIQQLGGRITVESQVGVGTTFHVFLPLVQTENLTVSPMAKP